MPSYTSYALTTAAVLSLPVMIQFGTGKKKFPGRFDGVADAVDAVGGSKALLALGQWSMMTTGANWLQYEGETPEELSATSTYEQTIMIDIEKKALRTDTISRPLFEGFQFFPLQNFTRIAVGTVGYTDAQLFVPAGNIPSDSLAGFQRRNLLFNPHLFLRKMLLAPRTILSITDTTIVLKDPVSDVTLTFDESTGFITQLQLLESNPLTRDISVVITYAEWDLEASDEEGNTLIFPRKVTMNADGGLVWEETRLSVDVSPSFTDDTFALPEGTDMNSFNQEQYDYGQRTQHFQGAFFFLGAYYDAFASLVTEKFAPGLFLITSFSNSVAIVGESGIVIIEAPSSDMYAKILVEEVRGLVPDGEDIPIKYVVQSHHHVDHASGLREMVALGIDVVFGPEVLDFWQRVIDAPSMIIKDTMADTDIADRGNLLQVEESGNLLVFDEGPGLVVTAYHAIPGVHGADMLIVVIQTDVRLYVYQADLYNTGLGFTVVNGGQKPLFDRMKEIGVINDDCTASRLDVSIIPAHGVILTLEESIAELERLEVDAGC